MNCIVTAGPTYEPLDEVRRLTNFSSGKLGTLLANFLTERGHRVTLLRGHYSTFDGEQKAQQIQTFTTTEDLRQRLSSRVGSEVQGVFHAAAVSDFGFGKILERQEDGTLVPTNCGKISTRGKPLLAELVPTPKILRELQGWFPSAAIIGWKYEVAGKREEVISKAQQQILESKTSACVANGPAYGFGFGVVTPETSEHYSDLTELFAALESIVIKH